MSTTPTLLLLGTNLGDKLKNLEQARISINTEIGSIVKEGEIVQTEPVDFTSNHMFLNQLILVENDLSPINLLKNIKNIENQMGRVYTKPLNNQKHTSRIIDIDILRMGSLKYESFNLNIPHIQIDTREFVRIMLKNF